MRPATRSYSRYPRLPPTAYAAYHQNDALLQPRQQPIEHWHDALGDPTLADAILDRLVHNAHRITLKGESLRKRQSTIEASHTGCPQAAARQR